VHEDVFTFGVPLQGSPAGLHSWATLPRLQPQLAEVHQQPRHQLVPRLAHVQGPQVLCVSQRVVVRLAGLLCLNTSPKKFCP